MPGELSAPLLSLTATSSGLSEDPPPSASLARLSLCDHVERAERLLLQSLAAFFFRAVLEDVTVYDFRTEKWTDVRAPRSARAAALQLSQSRDACFGIGSHTCGCHLSRPPGMEPLPHSTAQVTRKLKNAQLLARTAHSAAVLPSDPSMIYIFGAWRLASCTRSCRAPVIIL